jgi:hypothetical protein
MTTLPRRASFVWWDDAVGHATWLAARTGIRRQVYRSWCGLWCVRVALVRA